VTSEGVIVVNRSPSDAEFADLFKGEETGNRAVLAMAKVQMFLITIVVGIIYALILGTEFLCWTGNTTLPGLGKDAVSLIAISHGRYLVHKAIPLSKST
jgi:hypothetical protein